MKLPLLLSALTLLASLSPAQMAAPVVPSGQPAIMPITPLALGLVPPPVLWMLGNPGFALAPFAPPPVPIGLPKFLVIGVAAPPIVIPAPFAFPAFGPALLTNLGTLVIPAGLSGPVAGPPIPLPLPATGGPLGVTLTVHTLVLAGPSIILTGALGIML
jgi:hypothetical protein